MEREEYDALETMRKRALDVGDAERYFLLCDQLGLKKVDLENPKLYDAGRQPKFDFGGDLEKSVTGEAKPIGRVNKRRVKLETYIAFEERADHISGNDVRAMRNILFDFFPIRFGPNGTHPLSRTDDTKTMGMYHGTRNYAKRRINE